ncbi:hypothetical protein [Cylindrospermopsis raciborskii]|uniref:hypothetical protein n=1 Tax=Cylindrospermopsis raciborskii TaxID=77022 RepID=UPI0022BEB0D0|nr:hypothetical protein [Cylindrospermopsis raciborskii]MCZ2207316.1 hypothetical protein [Cylindrospermopsis raciborskii PAMP2011]
MQGSLLGKHSLQVISHPHVFILQNCDRPLTPFKFSLEKIRESAIALQLLWEIVLLTTFKFSLEKMQGSLLGNHSLRAIAKHSLCEIAPPHIFIVQNCDRLFNRPQNFP